MLMQVNTPLEITWDKQHVTGCRLRSTPSAPPSQSPFANQHVTCCSDLRPGVESVWRHSTSCSSGILTENHNKKALTVDVERKSSVSMTTTRHYSPTNQRLVVPSIKLDTQFVVDDDVTTWSCGMLPRTPVLYGLSSDFVVSSAFRRRYLQHSTEYDVTVQRPPAYNPAHNGKENQMPRSTSTYVKEYQMTRSASTYVESKRDDHVKQRSYRLSGAKAVSESGRCLNWMIDRKKNIAKHLKSTPERQSLFNEQKKENNHSNEHHSNNSNADDDDVFLTEENLSVAIPSCSSTASADHHCNQRPLEPTLKRLFRFSIRSLGMAISSPRPIKSTTPDESCGQCLAVRGSRIAVCPVSGDLLVVDVSQSLIQFYKCDGRLESCTLIPGVSGGCFLDGSDQRHIAISCLEPRGLVELYYRAGSILIHEDRTHSIGSTLNVVTYRNGFIAVQSNRLLIYTVQPYLLELVNTISEPLSQCESRRSSVSGVTDNDFLDCRPMPSGDIAVLQRERILIVNSIGQLISSTSDPQRALLRMAVGAGSATLAVDYSQYTAIVCCPASRQLLRFNMKRWGSSHVMLDLAVNEDVFDGNEIPVGIDIDSVRRRLILSVWVDGGERSEVRIFQL